ncbi:tetratricopeptide repeat protein [Myxococcus sp. 1LA]
MAWWLTLSLLAAAPGAGSAAKKPEDAEALRTRATRLYRAKKLEEACPLFERAAQLAPEHGPTLADLGLCLQKQGRKSQALAIFLRALKVSGADARTRANVYFNLAAFHDVTPEALTLEHEPTPRGHYLSIRATGPCADLPSSEPSCGSVLQACLSEWKAPVEVVYADTPPMFYTDTGFNMHVHGAGAREDAATSERRGETDYCANVPSPADGDSPRARHCIYWGSNELLDDCHYKESVCEAQRASWRKNTGQCKFVYVNPCEGRVAVVCDGERFAPKQTWVGEVSVTPVR